MEECLSKEFGLRKSVGSPKMSLHSSFLFLRECVGLSSFFSRLRSERTNQIFRTELNSRFPLLSNTNLEAYYSPK